MGLCNEKFSTNIHMNYFQSFLFTKQYEQTPIVPIEQAIQPLISFIPYIEKYLEKIKSKCLKPFDGLTSDESASIMLYSMIWQPFDQCLYMILNSILKILDEINLQPWLLYLKLFFTALLNLPSYCLIVYRGSKKNLLNEYKINQIITWYDLSLCTISLDNLKKENNLKIIFQIQSNTVKNISQHCYFEFNDLVLFLPLTKFQVRNCIYQKEENIYLIQLQEIQSSIFLHLEQLNKKKISLNIFQKFCLIFKQSEENNLSIINDHYRNSILEHRIINNENSWTIDLDRQNLNDHDMKIVMKYAIIKNRCKRIRLRNNNITSQGCSILSEGLYNNTILETLDLCNNHLSNLGVQVLSLPIIYSNIKTLNLESNEITLEGAKYLADIIENSRTLVELYLSKNHLGDRGVELLANALNNNNKINIQQQSNKGINQSILQHLYLGQNDITDEGLKYLSNMLKTNRTLTWLWLSDNEISNDGIEYLSNILVNYNFTLEWLFLNSNKLINDLSMDDLIYMLKRNQTLKTLYLNNCNLSEITKRKLLQIIQTKKDFDLEV